MNLLSHGQHTCRLCHLPADQLLVNIWLEKLTVNLRLSSSWTIIYQYHYLAYAVCWNILLFRSTLIGQREAQGSYDSNIFSISESRSISTQLSEQMNGRCKTPSVHLERQWAKEWVIIKESSTFPKNVSRKRSFSNASRLYSWGGNNTICLACKVIRTHHKLAQNVIELVCPSKGNVLWNRHFMSCHSRVCSLPLWRGH